jgi:ubiquinone/menaquinone biosynthesis C-methylase UbiE
MWSYEQHEQQEKVLSTKEDLPSCYTKPESVDAWRHQRMLNSVLPIANRWPGSSWLTVGDGRFGTDAHFLASLGLNVTATSISSHTLEIALARGFINKFAVENVERLTLNDDEVDFVLCKEAFHHFPRPTIGLYEMLRVAKKAVVLIEPIEDASRAFDQLKRIVKRALRKGDTFDQFEPAGNFIYRVNIREVAKMLTALNLTCLAYRRFNDFWCRPFESAVFRSLNVGSIGTRAAIAIEDVLAKLRLMSYGLATVICFKQEIQNELGLELRRDGFTVEHLPRNPYLDVTGNGADERMTTLSGPPKLMDNSIGIRRV